MFIRKFIDSDKTHHFFSSVQLSHSVVSDSLWPHESQHARPPCPSPTPGVYSNSCASSWWCCPAISSSVVPFSICPESLPASGSFPMSQLFAWGGQSIGVSASASVLPVNTQDWSPVGWLLGTYQLFEQWWNHWINSPKDSLSCLPSNLVLCVCEFYFYLYGCVIDLHCCVSFRCIATWLLHIYVYLFFFGFFSIRGY